jgi:hypothetical protein
MGGRGQGEQVSGRREGRGGKGRKDGCERILDKTFVLPPPTGVGEDAGKK